MFAVTVTFVLKPGCRDSFLPLMVENAKASRDREMGCRQFDVCHNDDGRTVFLYEIYDNEAAFQEHLKSDHFLAFEAAVDTMIETKAIQQFERVIQ